MTKPKPKKRDPLAACIKEIVLALEADLNNRRGFHMDTLDEDIRSEMKLAWKRIVARALAKLGGGK